VDGVSPVQALYMYIKSAEMEIIGIYEGIECSCPIETLCLILFIYPILKSIVNVFDSRENSGS